jgi:hypothetical protein
VDRDASRTSLNNNNMSNLSHAPSTLQLNDDSKIPFTTMTPQQISMWIDRRARFIFPLAFVAFNGFYWTFVLLL